MALLHRILHHEDWETASRFVDLSRKPPMS
jgi:hypothetical protein